VSRNADLIRIESSPLDVSISVREDIRRARVKSARWPLSFQRALSPVTRKSSFNTLSRRARSGIIFLSSPASHSVTLIRLNVKLRRRDTLVAGYRRLSCTHGVRSPRLRTGSHLGQVWISRREGSHEFFPGRTSERVFREWTARKSSPTPRRCSSPSIAYLFAV